METADLHTLDGILADNLAKAKAILPRGNLPAGLYPVALAITATVIDTLRKELGEYRGFTELARQRLDEAVAAAPGASHPENFQPATAQPTPPEGANDDPSPLSTQVAKRLGALGLSNMDELEGYRIGKHGRVLLGIKGRLADSGWKEQSRHFEELKRLMSAFGVPFEEQKPHAETD